MLALFVRRFVVALLGLALACGADRLRLGGQSVGLAIVGQVANSSARVWPWHDKSEEAKHQDEVQEEKQLDEQAPQKAVDTRRFTATPPPPVKGFGDKNSSPMNAKPENELRDKRNVSRNEEVFDEKEATTSTTITTTTTLVIITTTTTSTSRRQLRPPPRRAMRATLATTTATTTALRTYVPPTTTAERNMTAGASYGREPKVYFLFLAVDKISNLGVWESFFSHASRTQYRAFVHCKEPSCKLQGSGSVIKSIPTVPSYYCTDLVSPMNKLISYALDQASDDAHPQDKFAFISDSTLPAKSFQEIHRTLTDRDGSDFCVFPAKEWADVRQGSELEMAPKAHQWITLTRAHAEKASRLWSQGHLHNIMDHFELNKKTWLWTDNSYADSRNFGCLDEFWHMAAIFGTLNHVLPHSDTEYVSLEHFSGGNLHGSLHISDKEMWQGECDTFVMWSAYMNTGVNNAFERFYSELDQVSVPHTGTGARPGWWDTISENGIKAMKDSDFLFVRKFIDHPKLADSTDSFQSAYSRIVFN